MISLFRVQNFRSIVDAELSFNFAEGKSESIYLQQLNIHCRNQGIPLLLSHVNAEGGSYEKTAKAIKHLDIDQSSEMASFLLELLQQSTK